MNIHVKQHQQKKKKNKHKFRIEIDQLMYAYCNLKQQILLYARLY